MSVTHGATNFVDCDVVSEGNGASWGTAFKTLTNAAANVADGDQVWIAEGTY